MGLEPAVLSLVVTLLLQVSAPFHVRGEHSDVQDRRGRLHRGL